MNEVIHSPESERYEIHVDGQRAGITTAKEHDGVVLFDYTEVDDAYEGKGVGAELVAGALDDVRRRGLRIEVTCEYVKHFLEKHPENADLVADET